MALLVLVVIIAVPLALAIVTTRAPRWLTLVFETRRFVPPAPDDAGREGYRGYVPSREVVAHDFVQLEVAELPSLVRHTATACRVAFCLAMTTVGSVLFLLLFSPILAVGLGVSGLALAGGQQSARSALLSGSARGASHACGVGIWTIVHQVVVLGVVAFASGPRESARFAGDQALEIVALGDGGAFVVAYVVASLGLGAALIHASRSLVSWRALRAAV